MLKARILCTCDVMHARMYVCTYVHSKQLYSVAMENFLVCVIAMETLFVYHFVDSDNSPHSDSQQGDTDDPQNMHEP